MKAYVIVKESSEVQYLWHDEEFLGRLEVLQRERNEASGPSNDPSQNYHFVQMILQPIVVSYFLLQNNFNDTFTVISGVKIGCNIVFQQHDDLLYLGFCKRDELSVYNMKKQLHVLHQMTEFIFGPCKYFINPEHDEHRSSENWRKLTEALHCFNELYLDELSFVVGCIDKLHINDDIRMTCSGLKSLIRRNTTGRISFGLLFVGNKLVVCETGPKCKYSISTSDMIKIIILMNSKYEELENLAAVYEASSAADAFDLSYSDETSDDDDDVFTPQEEEESEELTPTPSLMGQESPKIDIPNRSPPAIEITPAEDLEFNKHEDYVLGTGEMTSSDFGHSQSWHDGYGFMQRRRKSLQREENMSISVDRNDYLRPVASESQIQGEMRARRSSLKVHSSKPSRHSTGSKQYPRIMEEVIGEDLTAQIDQNLVQTYNICLHTTTCNHTPFLMHITEIKDGVRLVILSEMKGVDVASVVCKFISNLNNVTFAYKSDDSLSVNIHSGQKTIDELGRCCKQLKAKIGHFGDSHFHSIFETWDKKLFHHLWRHLKQLKGVDTLRMKNDVDELTLNLQRLFCRLFLLKSMKPKDKMERLAKIKIVDSIKCSLMKKLHDYLGFLMVKSCRNIAVDWDRKQYPGLLHSTVIKRSSAEADLDEVFASALYIPSEDKDDPLVTLLKKQVWKGIMLAYFMIDGKDGISKFAAVDGDFRFTSYFYDKLDRAMHDYDVSEPLISHKKSWSGEASISGVEGPFQNSKLKSTSGHTYLMELHLVHFSTVLESTVTEQSKRLFNENFENL